MSRYTKSFGPRDYSLISLNYTLLEDGVPIARVYIREHFMFRWPKIIAEHPIYFPTMQEALIFDYRPMAHALGEEWTLRESLREWREIG